MSQSNPNAGRTRPLILVIDDDEVLLQMVKVTLGKRGYDVILAANGEEGFALAHRGRPDLIVLDIQLPDITGYTVMSRLRSSPELFMTPVIFCSSLADPKNRLHGFSLGADDFLSKPFRLEELSTRIARSLGRGSEAERRVRTQAKDRESDGVPALQGSIEQIGLAAILLLIEMERGSGILRVTSGDGELITELSIFDGRIFRGVGQSEGGQPLKNAEAVYDVLSWSAGTFQFMADESDVVDEVQVGTSHLLMEAARRLDEARHGGGE